MLNIKKKQKKKSLITLMFKHAFGLISQCLPAITIRGYDVKRRIRASSNRFCLSPIPDTRDEKETVAISGIFEIPTTVAQISRLANSNQISDLD